jgi:hypothetical protein
VARETARYIGGMTEDEARRVVLVQAHEAGAPTPVWTDDDRAWATRAARQDAPQGRPFDRFVVARSRHALERLLPRDAAARRWLERRAWRAAWLLVAGLLAFVLGIAVDHIGASQRVDVLAPPVWAVAVWNLAVYASLLVPHPVHGLRRVLARAWQGGPAGVRAFWAGPAARLAQARAALVLHVASASLALGLVAGLYLRGLVLDYRAVWQSTFLDAGVVQAVLDAALAPAAALTGIAVPAVAPLRAGPADVPTASAAPWIHLYAATLLLVVVLPRAVLAAIAAWRASRLVRRFPLALQGPYFDRLKLQHQGGRAVIEVRPHAAPLAAQEALGLRALLATQWGDAFDLQVADPVPYGDEERVAAQPAVPGATVRVAVFDLAATPEAEAQGRLLDALAGALPVVAVADEAAFKRRFAATPERLAERRAAWRRLAEAHGARLVCADLAAPDLAAAAPLLRAALA